VNIYVKSLREVRSILTTTEQAITPVFLATYDMLLSDLELGNYSPSPATLQAFEKLAYSLELRTESDSIDLEEEDEKLEEEEEEVDLEDFE